MNVFDASSFTSRLYKKNFTREEFLTQAKAKGADTILVDARFFPERAMYWTRMFRSDAQKMEISMKAIVRSSLLATEDANMLEAAKSDLLEWIRIAALSQIPNLHIKIDGVKTMDEAAIQSLAASLQPVFAAAQRYGTMLVFCRGTADITDEALLILLKSLGYTACRAIFALPPEGNDAAWIA